jgi:hypothetical protein
MAAANAPGARHLRQRREASLPSTALADLKLEWQLNRRRPRQSLPKRPAACSDGLMLPPFDARSRSLARAALLTACLGLAGCGDPSDLLQDAERSRSPFDYEHVIARYPDSPEANVARTRIADVAAWTRSQGSIDTATYRAYLAEFPDGMFANQATDSIADLEAGERAAAEDTVEALRTYLTAHPIGLLVNRSTARADELRPAEARYQAALVDSDPKILADTAIALEDTGYARSLWIKAGDQAADREAKRLAEEPRFREFGDVSSLRRIPTDLPPQRALALREARERVALARVDASRGCDVFVIPLEVETDLAPHRFSIAAKSEPTRLQSYRSAESDTFGGLRVSASARKLMKMPARRPRGPVAIFDEIPGDEVVFVHGETIYANGNLGFDPSGVGSGTGAVELPRLSAVHRAARTIWRVYGDVPISADITIVGDDRDPMSFYLLPGIGAAYLAGYGKVIGSDGRVIFEVTD